MIAMGTDEWTCAVCGAPSEQMRLEAGQPEEPPDFDSRPGEPVRSTIRHWMHECPHCGYAAPDLRISVIEAGGVMKSDRYKTLRSDEAIPLGTRRFLCHALILEEIGSFADAGWTCLHGAWLSDDEESDEAARRCRRDAVRLWRHGKEHGQSFGEEYAQEFALVVDVQRRAGDFDAAREACLEALQIDDLDPVIEDMLRLQLTLIQRRDTSCHSLREVLDRPSGGERVTLQ